MKFTRKDGSKTIDHTDAQILEDYEEQQILNHNTNKAISDTYGPKQPTKARRKLPGKRKWKNKDQQYAKLRCQMTTKLFNKKQAATKVIDRLYKEKLQKRNRHTLVDNA